MLDASALTPSVYVDPEMSAQIEASLPLGLEEVSWNVVVSSVVCSCLIIPSVFLLQYREAGHSLLRGLFRHTSDALFL